MARGWLLFGEADDGDRPVRTLNELVEVDLAHAEDSIAICL